MGCCFGSGNDEHTNQIDRQLRNDNRRDAEVIKLLFLGAGGSGKSTLFKQLRLLHGAGLQENERKLYKKNVHANIIEGLKLLARQFQSDDDDDLDEEKGDVYDLASRVLEYEEPFVSKDILKLFDDFWNNKDVQNQWTNRSQLQIQDSLEYFLGHLVRIVDPSYIPSTKDCLRVRARTTGIVEETFNIKNRTFLIVDVGGQRSERKKWIKCFDGVTGIIFVVSLSGYDQLLFEDENTIRMQESLKVFRDLNNEHLEMFKESSIILFLNKSDLFEQKIKQKPITCCFPEYQGPHTDESSYNYIKSKFLEQNQLTNRKVFVHRTCATDTSQMKHIFDAVNHTIINRALIKAGLLVA